MRRFSLIAFCYFCLITTSLPLNAGSKNSADYPLRIQIFGKSETGFYYHGFAQEFEGEGRANLFADNEVHGVNFNFNCSQKLKSSFGYETYPAKWKKPNQELVVLLPVFGKSNSYFTCNLKTDVKDYAYFFHQGRLLSESPAEFKAWMVTHDYDPEHGKDTPIRIEPKPGTALPSPAQQ